MTFLPPRSRMSRLKPQGPVFVDSSGRKLRRMRVAGAVALALVVGYAVLLAVALFGGGPNAAAPLLPSAAFPGSAQSPATVAPTPGSTSAAGTPGDAVDRAVPASTAVPVPARQEGPAAGLTSAAAAAPAPTSAAAAATTPANQANPTAPGQTRRPTAPTHP